MILARSCHFYQLNIALHSAMNFSGATIHHSLTRSSFQLRQSGYLRAAQEFHLEAVISIASVCCLEAGLCSGGAGGFSLEDVAGRRCSRVTNNAKRSASAVKILNCKTSILSDLSISYAFRAFYHFRLSLASGRCFVPSLT